MEYDDAQRANNADNNTDGRTGLHLWGTNGVYRRHIMAAWGVYVHNRFRFRLPRQEICTVQRHKQGRRMKSGLFVVCNLP